MLTFNLGMTSSSAQSTHVMFSLDPPTQNLERDVIMQWPLNKNTNMNMKEDLYCFIEENWLAHRSQVK